MGPVEGTCSACGKRIRRKSPVPILVTCDCYRYCPLCGALMTPYTPDLNPRIYRNEGSQEWDPTGSAEKGEATTGTLYICHNHTPPYYSDKKPVEVLLE